MTLKEKRLMMESLGKKAVIFCDMDGVLAKWEAGCTFERTLEPHYFRGLELEECVKNALLSLHEAGFEVCVLSAAYIDGTAREDKRSWLEDFGLGELNYKFTICGENKANFIDTKPGVNYILLDDYNVNLLKWSECTKNDCNFIAVKFLNGINGGSDTWKGRTVYHRSSGNIIAHTLADIAVMS